MNKLLLSEHPALGLDLLMELGLMQWILPEVVELRGVSQQHVARSHSKDVYAHVLRVVERSSPELHSRWSALLHDIAKPRTRGVGEDGAIYFFGHEEVGARMARDMLKGLHFDRDFIDSVSRIVQLHMRANAYASDWTDGAVRRLMLDASGCLPYLLDLSRADITSYRTDKVNKAEARVAELAERCQHLREEAERVPIKSPLDGTELMELFGRGPGPWLKPIKEHLLSLVIDGQLAPDDKATATAIACEMMAASEKQNTAAVAKFADTDDSPRETSSFSTKEKRG